MSSARTARETDRTSHPCRRFWNIARILMLEIVRHEPSREEFRRTSRPMYSVASLSRASSGRTIPKVKAAVLADPAILHVVKVMPVSGSV